MEANRNHEKDLAPILQLRQDDVVAIPIERYEGLLDCETRLTILFQRRRDEVLNFKEHTYQRDEDYILCDKMIDVWKERERLAAEYRAAQRAAEEADYE